MATESDEPGMSSGFTLLGEIDFPARRGGFVRCNDWRFDLFPSG